MNQDQMMQVIDVSWETALTEESGFSSIRIEGEDDPISLFLETLDEIQGDCSNVLKIIPGYLVSYKNDHTLGLYFEIKIMNGREAVEFYMASKSTDRSLEVHTVRDRDYCTDYLFAHGNTEAGVFTLDDIGLCDIAELLLLFDGAEMQP